MMVSTELTSLLRPPSPSPQEILHQTPTPPDSPIPSQTSRWFEPVGGKEEEAQPQQPAQPLRSTRHRRVSVTVSWPKKRLFTPDIKRMLKSWLIRRRDNPYPSRAEKEALASTTGLTYMQICNWFANWRRKLRKSATTNAGTSGTWGRLIKRYNTTACAATAAEQFSISSGDSIWGGDTAQSEEVSGDHSYVPRPSNPARSRRRRRLRRRRRRRPPTQSAIPSTMPSAMQSATQGPSPLLSKWLESAAKYHLPSLSWATNSDCSSVGRHPAPEELDAAEALTRLSIMIGECHTALC